MSTHLQLELHFGSDPVTFNNSHISRHTHHTTHLTHITHDTQRLELGVSTVVLVDLVQVYRSEAPGGLTGLRRRSWTSGPNHWPRRQRLLRDIKQILVLSWAQSILIQPLSQ